MWTAQPPSLVSGSAFAALFNKGVPSSPLQAQIEYCGLLTHLPDGKTIESPDKVLGGLKFWITRKLGDS